MLKEAHAEAWGEADSLSLAVVRLKDEEVVGGATVSGPRSRLGTVRFRMAPWLPLEEADDLCSEAMRVVVPWLRDELELMTVTVDIAADETATVAAATALGMVLGVRLREHFARPGGRVDLLRFQALSASPRVPEEVDA